MKLVNEQFQQYLSDKRADSTLISSLLALENEEQLVFVDILEWEPSANTLRDLFNLALEIGQRDNLKLDDVFRAIDYRSIFEMKSSRKEKQKCLKRRLESLRYPEKTRLIKTATQYCSVLNNEFGVVLHLPDELEGSKISLEFSAASAEEIGIYAEKIKAISESREVRRLFSILRGEDDVE